VIGALLLACVLLLVTGAGLAEGARADRLKEKKAELGEVRQKLERARARASALRTQEASLLAELERLDRGLAGRRIELRRLDARIGRLERQLAMLTGARGRMAEDIVVQQAALAARLRVLDGLRHRPGPPDGLPAAAGAGVAAARARAVGDLARVARVDLEQLVEFGEAAERLETREERVARARRELLGLRGAVQTERAAMNREVGRRRVLLADVRDDRATHERMAAELTDAGRRLEALVRELSRRPPARRAAIRRGEPERPPAVGLGALRGRLPWPTEGRIVGTFGRQVHPRFGTETFRQGVDIEAPEGTAVRAVYAGTVLYRGWLKGYGNLVILDHGQGYYTLYGHAADVLVDEGDVVGAGRQIARVGETGSLAGPSLYFEVRYQGRPEDPAEWLRRRS
jgi:septal ring factor EnvC (AmiA/AmiB activator)